MRQRVELGGEAIGDSEIAALLTEYSESVTLKVEEIDEDAEIAALQERYHRLVADETEERLRRFRLENEERLQRFRLENEERLKAAKAAKRARISELQRQLNQQRAKFAEASERFCASDKKFLPVEIVELNWSICLLEIEISNCRLSLSL